MYQSFVAALECPVCHRVSPESDSTGMQTSRLPLEGPVRFRIVVGDRIRMDFPRLELAGYRVVREPGPSEMCRVLVDWECPHCGTAYLWAVIYISFQHEWATVDWIESAPCTRETLDSVHAASGLIVNYYASGSGHWFEDVAAAMEGASCQTPRTVNS